MKHDVAQNFIDTVQRSIDRLEKQDDRPREQ